MDSITIITLGGELSDTIHNSDNNNIMRLFCASTTKTTTQSLSK
jgi:hypothetical protein